jgi:hypothetical protein
VDYYKFGAMFQNKPKSENGIYKIANRAIFETVRLYDLKLALRNLPTIGVCDNDYIFAQLL